MQHKVIITEPVGCINKCKLFIKKRPWYLPRPVRLNKKRELYIILNVRAKIKFTHFAKILTYVTNIIFETAKMCLNCGIIEEDM